jgi:hypothetical protein
VAPSSWKPFRLFLRSSLGITFVSENPVSTLRAATAEANLVVDPLDFAAEPMGALTQPLVEIHSRSSVDFSRAGSA